MLLGTRAVALLGATLLASLSFSVPGGGRNNLVQDKVYDFLDEAETSYMAGNAPRALAYSQAAAMQGTIKVAVDFDAVPDRLISDATSSVTEAFELWEDALDRQIQFEIVSPKEAVLRISFKDSVHLMGREVAGYAVWSRQVYDWGNGKYTTRTSGDISLRTSHPSHGDFSHQAMVHAAAHEIGHYLGLWDSPRVGDIMGPLLLDRPCEKLSEPELSAIKGARSRADFVIAACNEQVGQKP